MCKENNHSVKKKGSLEKMAVGTAADVQHFSLWAVYIFCFSLYEWNFLHECEYEKKHGWNKNLSNYKNCINTTIRSQTGLLP